MKEICPNQRSVMRRSKTKTGKSWDDWFALMDADGCTEMNCFGLDFRFDLINTENRLPAVPVFWLRYPLSDSEEGYRSAKFIT